MNCINKPIDTWELTLINSKNVKIQSLTYGFEYRLDSGSWVVVASGVVVNIATGTSIKMTT